jgi:hypothetical protein
MSAHGDDLGFFLTAMASLALLSPHSLEAEHQPQRCKRSGKEAMLEKANLDFLPRLSWIIRTFSPSTTHHHAPS